MQLATIGRRARRLLLIAGLTYLGAVIVFHGAVAAGVVVARLQGRAPRAPAPIELENLRRVDDKVWASAQPEPEHYRALAAAGVEIIVDLRTDSPDDRGLVDERQLASHGITRVRLPVRDGHVPGEAIVDRLLELTARHDGIVLVQCGAGVGRSSTLAAGYLEHRGGDVSLWDTLALGSVTLEQAWFLTTGDRNAIVGRLSEALDAPRRGWSRLINLLS